MWFARIVKTRSLAQKLITGGKVRVNRNKVTTASTKVAPGDVLTVTLPRDVLVYEIVELGTKRGPFSEAQLLYKNLSPPKPEIEEDTSSQTEAGFTSQGRPDKRQRRKLISMQSAGQFGE